MAVLAAVQINKLTIHEDKLSFTYTGERRENMAVKGTEAWKYSQASGDGIKYYELTAKSAVDAVGIGLGLDSFTTDAMPGWLEDSWGYHGDDGNKIFRGKGAPLGPTWGAGDTAGFGLKLKTGELFATLNGKYLGVVAHSIPEGEYKPVIGANAACEVTVNFRGPFKFDVAALPEELTPPFREVDLEILSESASFVLFVDQLGEEEKEKLKKEVDPLAREFHEKGDTLKFFYASLDRVASRVRDYLSLTRVPAAAILNIKAGEKYVIPEGAITAQSVKDFVTAYKNGTAARHVKSEARPEGDKVTGHPNITKLVNTSFKELVLNHTKDVFVDVYADWCGPCVAFAPTYAIVADALAGSSTIVIAKLDCDRNDTDKKYFPENSIPNIKLFPGNDKENPIKYQGNRTTDDVLEFLHTNAHEKFDLDAVKAKAKKLVDDAKKNEHKLVKLAETDEQYNKIVEEANAANKLIVVDFYATWCPPCKMIAPVFANYSEQYKDAVFVKVNVDELADIAAQAGISCMPTFHLYKGGNKVDSLEGADKAALAKLIEKNL